MTVTTMSSIWYSAKYPGAGQKQRKDRDRPDALISLTVSRRAIAADLETVRSRSSVKAAMPHQRGAWVPSRAILRTIKVIFPTSCPVSSLVRRRTRDASPACGRSNLPASFPRQAGERQALEVVVPPSGAQGTRRRRAEPARSLEAAPPGALERRPARRPAAVPRAAGAGLPRQLRHPGALHPAPAAGAGGGRAAAAFPEAAPAPAAGRPAPAAADAAHRRVAGVAAGPAPRPRPRPAARPAAPP